MALDGVPFVRIDGEVHAQLPGSSEPGNWVWAEVVVDVGEPGRDLLDRVTCRVSLRHDPIKSFAALEREARNAAIDSLTAALNLIA